MLVGVLSLLCLEWAVHLAADEANGRVPVSVHPACACGVADVQHARAAASEHIPKEMRHLAGVVTEVLKGGGLLELAGGPVLVEAAATVDLHGG